MDRYEASNGVVIEFKQDPDGKRYLLGTTQRTCGDMSGTLTHATGSEEGVDALREFFRAEEDERLRRWRFPEDPDFVVYAAWTADPPRRGVRGVTVLSESIPHRYAVWEDNIDTLYGTSVDEDARKRARDAARAYFEAHPEPKPWHEAKEGEVWVITYKGEEYPAIFQAGMFRDHGGSWDPDRITAGRRIYPEATS